MPLTSCLLSCLMEVCLTGQGVRGDVLGAPGLPKLRHRGCRYRPAALPGPRARRGHPLLDSSPGRASGHRLRRRHPGCHQGLRTGPSSLLLSCQRLSLRPSGDRAGHSLRTTGGFPAPRRHHPNASLEYYLNLWQWLDVPRGIESRRPEIVVAVRKQLGAARARAGTAAPEPGGPGPAPPSSAPAPEKATPPETRPPEGERKLVTVLVAGIVASEKDPEALRDLTTACFERLLPCYRALRRHGRQVHRARRSWPSSEPPEPTRTTPSERFAPPLTCARPLASFNEGTARPGGGPLRGEHRSCLRRRGGGRRPPGLLGDGRGGQGGRPSERHGQTGRDPGGAGHLPPGRGPL